MNRTKANPDRSATIASPPRKSARHGGLASRAACAGENRPSTLDSKSNTNQACDEVFSSAIRLAMLLCLGVCLPHSHAFQQPAEATAYASGTPTNPAPSAGEKHAVILCGLSGDAAHRALFAESVAKLYSGLTGQLGFAPANVRVFFGDEPQAADGPVLQAAVRSTREELEKAAAVLRDKLRSADTLWVLVLGHSHYDGRFSWLNLPGPDMHQFDFAKLFHGIAPAQQVFFLTTPTSGFFIKPLAAKGRVIVSATEADWETNETEFPHELARVLSAPPTDMELDVDQDGAVTLFDLYLTVARNLAQSYVERELLATEHPLLDDNGDGRGSEVQIDYLTVAQGGRAQPLKPKEPPTSNVADGGLSRAISLNFPPRESRPQPEK